LDATATVFLCAPYFEPESMGSPATGRAAARHAFQDGLFDSEGNEVPFDDLDQVAEAIRLGFQAGSQGDPPEGTPLDEDPPPVEPEPHPGDRAIEEFETEVVEPWERFRELAITSAPRNEEELRSAARVLVQAALNGLVPGFVVDTVARLLQGLGRGPSWSVGRESTIAAFVWLARSLGWPVEPTAEGFSVGFLNWGPGDLSEDVRSLPLPGFLYDQMFYSPFFAPRRAGLQSEWIPQANLPPSWLDELRVEELATVEQAALALSTDRLLLERAKSPRAAAPLITVALMNSFPREPSAAIADWQREEAIELAAAWIAASLPSGRLADHPVEREIHFLQAAALSARARWLREAHGRPGEARITLEDRYRRDQRNTVAVGLEQMRRRSE